MELDIFTLFPEWFTWFVSQRHVRNVVEAGSSVRFFNYRDHTPLSAGQVDDTPFGGGAGMSRGDRRIVALTASGRPLGDGLASELAREPALALLCGRYEGFDERIVEHLATDAISIGRYVLSGGELAAMVVADAVLRKLPGALGHVDSAVEESFSVALEGHPEYPHYTRPATYRGWSVPEVLLSGHHERIREWRREQSRNRSDSA
jgi:tRNA (guanine37-N1)-methyltransferase